MPAERVTQHEAIARAADLPRPSGDAAVFIGVDGFGGSGKSTFAARVAAAIPASVVVHVDHFAAPSVAEWDWRRFRDQVVLPLAAGRPSRYQRWDWHRDEGAEWHEIAPGHVVVVEGVSATRREVGAPWALTIWVDAPRELRLRRAAERDGEQMLATWLNRWMPEEETWAARAHPLDYVDLVVSGTEPP